MTKEIYIQERLKNSYSAVLNFYINNTSKASYDIQTTDVLLKSYAETMMNSAFFDNSGKVITYKSLIEGFREKAYEYLDSYFKVSKVLDSQGNILQFY